MLVGIPSAEHYVMTRNNQIGTLSLSSILRAQAPALSDTQARLALLAYRQISVKGAK